jgi:hypothetical protein
MDIDSIDIEKESYDKGYNQGVEDGKLEVRSYEIKKETHHSRERKKD